MGDEGLRKGDVGAPIAPYRLPLTRPVLIHLFPHHYSENKYMPVPS